MSGQKKRCVTNPKLRETFVKLANNSKSNVFVNEMCENTRGMEPPYITLDQTKDEMEYVPGENIITGNLHLGQRKLFLSELEFLLLWHEQHVQMGQDQAKRAEQLRRANEPLVLYIGAAPNNKMLLLSDLFPDMKFVLIDPLPFSIYIMHKGERISHRAMPHKKIVHLRTNNDIPYHGNSYGGADWVKFITTQQQYKIFIIEDYMTNEMAKLFSRANTILISDLRTTVNDDAPTNFDVIWNNAMLYNWIIELKPRFYILKFRIPYFDEGNLAIDEMSARQDNPDIRLAKVNGIDFLDDYKKRQFRYFDGRIYLQCFPGYKSTETRLISNTLDVIDYDLKNYESRMYYYNCITRSYTLHENPNAAADIGFDHCNCCAKENYLWTRYIQLTGSSKTVRDYVLLLSGYTRALLGKHNHGYLFQLTPEYYEQVYAMRAVARETNNDFYQRIIAANLNKSLEILGAPKKQQGRANSPPPRNVKQDKVYVTPRNARASPPGRHRANNQARGPRNKSPEKRNRSPKKVSRR